MSGRKIEHIHENPIDNILIDLSEPTSNFFKQYNFTPNHITTIGMIIGILSFFCIYKRYYVLAFILFWISYFFDCLDGYYARKYKMTSKFGDYYDHIRDVVVTGSILVIIYLRLDKKYKFPYILTMFAVILSMCTHFGCQERKAHDKSHNDCLSIYTGLCLNEDYINISRFFGCGTAILFMSIFILVLKRAEK